MTCSSFVEIRTQMWYPDVPRKLDDIRPVNIATKPYVAFERFCGTMTNFLSVLLDQGLPRFLRIERSVEMVED